MSAKFPVFVFPGAASHGTGQAECGVQRHDGPCRGGENYLHFYSDYAQDVSGKKVGFLCSRFNLGGYGLDKKELLATGRFEEVSTQND